MSPSPRIEMPPDSVLPPPTGAGRRSLLAAALLVVVGVAGCAGPEDRPSPGGEAEVVRETGPPSFGYAGPVGETDAAGPDGDEDEVDRQSLASEHETEEDWAILRRTLTWAREQGLERLPTGEIMAIVGTTFVGTPYVPHTLELPGAERLVVNLRALDCVTFVENMLAIALLLRTMPDDLLEREEEELRRRYREILTGIRYRGGTLSGYASRLHYFSDWIHDNEHKGLVRDVTRDLGGAPDTRRVHFMSSNVGSYRQLGESADALAAVRVAEEELTARERFRIPQEGVADVEPLLQNGDVIATTSTLDGLDVAHTGLVLRHGGRVHLLHAPLVGESVEISELPLADRLLRLSAQDGMVVARPVDPHD